MTPKGNVQKSRGTTATGAHHCKVAIQCQIEELFYGDFLAVRDSFVNIKKNYITGFIGPSGCGGRVLPLINRMNNLIHSFASGYPPAGRCQAALLPVDGVPHRPVAEQQPAQPRPARDRAARLWPSWASTSTRSRQAKSMPPWATAAWAGWPPASSTRWPPSACPASATASTTSTACSGRKSATASRSRSPTTGGPTPALGDRTAAGRLSSCRSTAASSTPTDREGNYNPMWLDWKVVIGVPHDMPIVGYGGQTVNYLRLFCRPRLPGVRHEHLQRGRLPQGGASRRCCPRTISKVLYPSDSIDAGRELRLVQEYFLVACALRDIVRRYLQDHARLRPVPRQGRHPAQRHASRPGHRRADAHPGRRERPALGEGLGDHHAPPCAYTNHTLLPEALEKWPVPLLETVLPRHLQIIYEINRRFLEQVAAAGPATSTGCGACR